MTARFRTMQRGAPPVRMPTPEHEQIERLVARLCHEHRVDASAVRVVRAPLRICPLGAHIDHQLGIVTGMTIDHSILLAFAPAADGVVHIDSENFASSATFDLENVPPRVQGDWGNYLRGAVLALQQSHQLSRGLVGVVGGDMPIGGLSSSAAVTIAYLLAFESIHDLRLSAEQNVALARYTENVYIGLNNGILDQTVILCSAPNHLTRIDCQSVAIDQVPFAADGIANEIVDEIADQPAAQPMQPFEILTVYSGVTHSLVGSDYNSRVAECQVAATRLREFAGQPALPAARLRDADEEVFRTEADRFAGRTAQARPALLWRDGARPTGHRRVARRQHRSFWRPGQCFGRKLDCQLRMWQSATDHPL
ncbi:MAG: hypothetical protein HC802_08155 [Caldilineaceae bacterium]|nr:hypothetical protein [Caldilineaceae bacterium]